MVDEKVRDDIRRVLEEHSTGLRPRGASRSDIEKLITGAVAEEREACAKVAEDWGERHGDEPERAGLAIADAIRLDRRTARAPVAEKGGQENK